MRLVFTVPVAPPRALSPNASRAIHWGTKTKARRGLAAAFRYAATEAAQQWTGHAHYPTPFFVGPVRCQVTVYRGRNAKPQDGDNILASLKAGFDALEQAGIVANDKQFIHLPVMQERDPAGKGYMTVELTDEEDA